MHLYIHYMKKILISLTALILIGCLSCIKQPNSDKISHTQAISDLEVFISALQEIHPDLFFDCNETSFNEEYQKIKKQLPDKPISKIELYKYIQPLTTLLRDGHTQLYFPKDELTKENPLVFPLSIEVNTNDSSINVTNECFPGTEIKKGSVITSINGIDANTLITEMLNYCGGERTAFRLSKVNRDFIHFLYMLYPNNTFKIEYSNGKGKIKSLINAIPYLQAEALAKKEVIAIAPYFFEVLDSRTIVMTFNSFSEPDVFKTFSDSMFRAVKKLNIENLIIDMRMNGGGDSDIGDELFQYISPVPFRQFDKTIRKYSDLQKKLALENFGSDYSSQPNGTYELTIDSLIPLRPNPLRFEGNTYLLISHTTFSSAGSLSWAFKKLKMGTIIGEESGGMSVCFGDIVIYKLPNSGISSTISYARIYEYDADDKNIHGTIPDIIIPQKDALTHTLQYISERH